MIRKVKTDQRLPRGYMKRYDSKIRAMAADLYTVAYIVERLSEEDARIGYQAVYQYMIRNKISNLANTK